MNIDSLNKKQNRFTLLVNSIVKRLGIDDGIVVATITYSVVYIKRTGSLN